MTQPTLQQRQAQAQGIIPPDDESVFNTLRTLQTETPFAYNAIVRPNNPPAGIGGFLFDIPGDEEVRLRARTTSYYLENNTTVQDNIAVEPTTITLRGMIAELALGIPTSPPSQSQTQRNPLIPAMMPAMTPQQTQDYNIQQAQQQQADTQGQNLAAAQGTWPSLYNFYLTQSANFLAAGGNVYRTQSQSKQVLAFLYFQQLLTGQQLCSVETPWGIYENCAILDVRALQNERTKMATDFTVVFQTMRFAGDATAQTGQVSGRTAAQLAPQTQNGNAGLTPANLIPSQLAPYYGGAGVA